MKQPDSALDTRAAPKRRSLRALGALALAAFALTSTIALSQRGGALDAAATNAAVTRLTTQLLESSQFAHHQLDDQLANKFLDRYLDSLDGSHMVFLQSDVAEFARYRPALAQATRVRGDTRPAHLIFARYLERLDQRAQYIAEVLKKEKLTFTTDERYAYDREAAPRPKDIAEARQLWRQHLRFEYLQEKLSGKSEAEIATTLSRRSARLVQTMRKLTENAVLELYLNALADVYDPHSDYLGREQLQSFRIGMNLSLAGIGAALYADEGYCVVRELIPGGPAARSGQLKSGDRIVGVAQGQETEVVDLVDLPLTQAVDLIRGPKGSSVRLTIIPAGAADEATRKTITLVRDEVKLEDQQAKASIVDLPVAGGRARRIGVIDLPAFYSGDGNGKGPPISATADVAQLLAKLKQEKVTGVVLDLRRNGGGSLEEAVNLTGLFIPSGPVVQTRDRGGRVEVGSDRDGTVQYAGPLVVLTSRLSASASEILAGALQDYGRAIVVGDSSTFGKGTVQQMIPLAQVMQREGFIPHDDPGALKITISKFYLPSGSSTQLEGVKSDILIPSHTDVPEIGEADLDNPLPWDKIPPARFARADRVGSLLPALRARSAQRVGADPAFVALSEDKERFRVSRETKSVSLNEVERRREKEELEARAEARRKAEHARAAARPPTWEITVKSAATPGLPAPMKPPKPFSPTPATGSASPSADAGTLLSREDEELASDDIVLREAQRILADAIDLLARTAKTAK